MFSVLKVFFRIDLASGRARSGMYFSSETGQSTILGLFDRAKTAYLTHFVKKTNI